MNILNNPGVKLSGAVHGISQILDILAILLAL